MTPVPALLLAVAVARAEGAGPPLPVALPAAAGLSAQRLARIDALVNEAIERKETPGAVVLVGRNGRVVFRRAYGRRALEPAPEPMTADTVFDLASLTKVVATASSVMTLVEDGRIRLSDRVTRYLPEFGAGGGEREKVTVEDLLLHRAGFAPDDPMDLYTGTPAAIFARKYRQPLSRPPGSAFVYSDVGYEVLGELVRAVSGEALDAYARRRIFGPLGMRETEFRPRGEGSIPASRIAPCEKRNGVWMRGEVHDPRAFALGGVAGHAGLFSTADDLARFSIAMLGGGPKGAFLSPAGLAAMTRPRSFGDDDLRGVGWDIHTGFASSRGELFPPGSFGHTGWTGTSLWIDPVTRTFVVLLTNRVHPDGSGNVIPLRAKVATVVASAILDVDANRLREASFPVALLAAAGAAHAAALRAPGAAPAAGLAGTARSVDVRTGIDVLEAEGFERLAGRRVALLTNQTGRTRDGRSTIDVLTSDAAKKAGVSVMRLFAPEHGIRGSVDDKVPDATDEKTGLPIRSLYGEARRPKPEDLAGLDAVVVDLQDAGVRFYTYLTTLGYLLEEAAKAHVAVVVLDRPNLVGADVVEGPPADAAQLSFTAYHAIPIRPGMTIGELAGLFNVERKLGAALTVVKMAGYRRSLWYDETGLPWVNPSPNLRSVTQAALYPGVALLETTPVSVGRGTDSPFEQFGAPWMDGARVAASLSARGVRGYRFTPVRFTPTSSTYAGDSCSGVRISLVDRSSADPVLLGLEIATTLRDLHPKDWNDAGLPKLLAHAASWERFRRGESAARIEAAWAAERMEFERVRAKHLLYD